MAIQLACITLDRHPIFGNHSPMELIIFSDSLSSIQALSKTEINNKIVLDTLEALNALGKRTRLMLKWIKAHNNYKGNEIADTQAKLGATKPAQVRVPIPKSEINNVIKSNTMKIWSNRYANQFKSSTMEILVPSLEPYLSAQLMKLSRLDLSIAVQYLTGHNFLLHHEKKMKTGNDRANFLNAKCRLCNREEETTQHMIFGCDALAKSRADTLGKYFIDPRIDKLDIHDVIKFIKAVDLPSKSIPEGHLTDLNPPTL